jgi:hypothetical protein
MRSVLFVDRSQSPEDDFILFKTSQTIGFSFPLKSNNQFISDSILRNLSGLNSELFHITIEKITSKGQKASSGLELIADLSSGHFSKSPEVFLIDFKEVVLKDLFKSTFLKGVFEGKSAHLKELNSIFKRARQVYFSTLQSTTATRAYSHQRQEELSRDIVVSESLTKIDQSNSKAYYIALGIEIGIHLLLLVLINYASLCRAISNSKFLYQLQGFMHQHGQLQVESWIQRIRHEPMICMTTINFLSVILFKPGLIAIAQLSFLLRNSLQLFLSFFKLSYKFIWRKFKDFFLLINDLYYSPQIKAISLGNLLLERKHQQEALQQLRAHWSAQRPNHLRPLRPRNAPTEFRTDIVGQCVFASLRAGQLPEEHKVDWKVAEEVAAVPSHIGQEHQPACNSKCDGLLGWVDLLNVIIDGLILGDLVCAFLV